MRCISLTMGTVISAAALLAAGPLYAQSDLGKMSQNANDWVMPAKDYANTRYSTLNQINTGNVGKLQVAWTFSTGVLRGHEGGPLVIGDVMYVHAPFPNTAMLSISTMTARSCGSTSRNRIRASSR